MKKLLFMLVCILLGIIPVNAEESQVVVPLTVKQTFDTTLESLSSPCTYELRALDGGEPYSFSLSGKEAEITIPLTYDHAGTYRYQLQQTTPEKEHYTYDRSVYDITVYIVNEKDNTLVPQVIASKHSSHKTDELIFTNHVSVQERPNIPETGVKTSPEGYILLMAVTAAVIAVMKKQN